MATVIIPRGQSRPLVPFDPVRLHRRISDGGILPVPPGRPIQTLRVTPAMEAGIADRVWELDEIVAMLD